MCSNIGPHVSRLPTFAIKSFQSQDRLAAFGAIGSPRQTARCVFQSRRKVVIRACGQRCKKKSRNTQVQSLIVKPTNPQTGGEFTHVLSLCVVTVPPQLCFVCTLARGVMQVRLRSVLSVNDKQRFATVTPTAQKKNPTPRTSPTAMCTIMRSIMHTTCWTKPS